MGVCYVDCEIADIGKPKKVAKVDHLLVDSGFEYTWINEDTLKEIGIKVEKKRPRF